MKEENKNFFQKVYEVAKLIPYGRVTSYGAIAKYLGAARSARMVGWAMNGAGSMPEIPAHRVVNKIGLLTNGEYLKEKNDISLAWAYKDCVLEGGQKKEDQKRYEIFYNEILDYS